MTDADRYPHSQAWALGHGLQVTINGERYVSMENVETIARAHFNMTAIVHDLTTKVTDLKARLAEYTAE